MSRIANVLGLDPFEMRLKNANRIGDTSPNRIVYTDPSTVAVVKALAGGIGRRARAGLRGDDDATRARATCCPSTSSASGRRPGGALMAKHTGRGIAAIEYPTGMNQNGDPSQAWIKVKPDGRVDVFAGTVRHRQRLEDDPVADRRRDDRRPLRLDHVRQLEHRLLPGLHRHVRLARDVRRRQGGREGGRAGQGADPRDRRQGARDRSRPTSRSSTARCSPRAPRRRRSRCRTSPRRRRGRTAS